MNDTTATDNELRTPPQADDAAERDAAAAPMATRIFDGAPGRIVLTVQAASPAHTRMLARVCAAGLEAAVLRAYGARLQQY